MTSGLTFFDQSVRAFGSPSRYVQGPGAIHWLGPAIAGLGDRALVVSDATVWSLLSKEIEKALNAQNIEVVFLEFSGDLLEQTAHQIAAQVRSEVGDVVLALGGGRAIDTGKALSELLNRPVVTVPTAASTDAPTSKNYVIYDECHRLKEVRHLPRNPAFVIVDTEILVKAPASLFAAGIGDALAKYHEARACASAKGRNMFHSSPTRTALAIAAECYSTLLSLGPAAFDALKGKKPTREFEDVVESTILMAGLGFENGGLSVAHALTRGLSQVEEAAFSPHGYQVAYGLLVQLALENEVPEPRLIELMSHVGLPASLREILGRDATPSDFAIVADGSINVTHMQNFPKKITTDALIDAMQSVEQNSKT
ncbi:MAG: glycerol dehydrogenase [Marivivens sp.]|nr:glycerol dehydrogenase [Marivivens sp.]